MRREPRSLVSLIAVATLAAAACSGGGADPPTEAVDQPTSATDSAAGSATTLGATVDQATTIPDEGSDERGEAGDLGAIRIADSDPDAIVDLGTTLMQTDRITVLLEVGSPRSTAEAVAAALGGEIIGELTYIDLYQASVPGGDEASVRAAIDQASRVPGVQVAYSDVPMTVFEEIWGVRTSPLDDPVYQGETGDGYRAIGVDRAWQYLRGSGIEPWGVKVGITDTRLCTGTDEFDNSKIKSLDPPSDESADRLEWRAPAGWQAEDSFELPDGSHGTAVATIIGADADDGGAAGVASILGDRLELSYSNVLDENISQYTAAEPDPNDPTQYVDSHGQTWSSLGLASLLKQVNAGAKVINMSWGCIARPDHPCSTESREAYRRFFSRIAIDHPDVVFVAAAGNYGINPDGSKSFPGGIPLPNVITVGNVNNDGAKNPSSCVGGGSFEVTIAAPGNEAVRGVATDGKVVDNTALVGTAINTTDGQRGGFTSGGGTSMATPQVTAAIALMKSLDPTLTAAEIKEILEQTARPGVPADPEASTYLPTPIDEQLGAGLLAVDEAVLAVINRVRTANGLDPIGGEDLVQFGVIDAVAITGEPNEYTIRATVTGCRGGCTEVSISVSGDHALSGSTTQDLAAPGDVTWGLTVTGDYPVTVFVQRLDNRAGSRILIDQALIAGTWTGTFTLQEITVPEGQELPDGSTSDGSAISGDELEDCMIGAGAAAGEAVRGAIDQWKEGFPFGVVFTGDDEEPGTATISILDNPDVTTPWRLDGSSVVFEWVDDDAVIAFSGTPNGATMSGAWGAVQSDGTELRGVFSLTRIGD